MNHHQLVSNMYSHLYSTEGIPIPLKSQIVDIKIVNQFADFIIDHHYLNDSDKMIETEFVFPVPAESSVYHLEAVDKITCIMKEKKEAKEEYEEAVNQGFTACHMEQQQGDTLTLSIGNIGPMETLNIKIKYLIELKTEEDYLKLRMNFPVTLMPKYTPVSTSGSKQQNKEPVITSLTINEKPFNMSITGSIKMDYGIKSIDSKTHHIKLTDVNENEKKFEINDLDKLDQDIILTIERKCTKSYALIEEFDKPFDEKYRYCTVMNLIPCYKDMEPIEQEKLHYVIILDSSGSMGGNDIEICKQAAQNFVAMIPISSSFDVYEFNTSFTQFNDNSSNMNQRKLKASEWITKITAGGGTCILPVFKHAYDKLDEIGKIGVIIFLSDGGVTNTEEILEFVKNKPMHSILPIGIGQNVSQNLIQGLATHGNGYAEFIGSGDHQIIDKVRAQLRRSRDILRKYQNDYKIQLDTLDSEYQIVPKKLPILYDRQDNLVFAFSEFPVTEIRYIEKINGSDRIQTLVPEDIGRDRGSMYHRISGSKLIDHLTDAAEATNTNESTRMKQVIDLSMCFNILSKYTAFIGVREENNKQTDKPLHVEIPLQLSTGHHNINPTQSTQPKYIRAVRSKKGYCGGQSARRESRLSGIGVNTISSMRKNATHDLRGQVQVPQFVISPWTSGQRIDRAGNVSGEKHQFHAVNWSDIPDPTTRNVHGTVNDLRAICCPKLNCPIFTGSTKDSDWRPRIENAPLFSPLIGAKNIYADPVRTEEFESRYVPERRKELAFQQVTVTPGLDIGYNMIGKQGYHDMYRVVPNANDKYSEEPIRKAKIVITQNMSGYLKLHGGLLTSITNNDINDYLSVDALTKLIQGDVISLTNESDPDNNGLYEIIEVGSKNQPWVLQKVN